MIPGRSWFPSRFITAAMSHLSLIFKEPHSFLHHRLDVWPAPWGCKAPEVAGDYFSVDCIIRFIMLINMRSGHSPIRMANSRYRKTHQTLHYTIRSYCRFQYAWHLIQLAGENVPPMDSRGLIKQGCARPQTTLPH